jgi:dihydrofolate reductase
MAKIVMFNIVSLDGYFADAGGGLDWFVADPEFDKAAADLIQRFDTILFGRVTYELFKGYWPNALTDPATSDEDRLVAQRIDEMTKIVFSKGAIDTSWRNSKLLSDITPEGIKQLKSQSSRDIVIYGSGTIVRQLTQLGLIDEYDFMIHPLTLGSGLQLFPDMRRIDLRLMDSTTFGSGNVLLRYEAA